MADVNLEAAVIPITIEQGKTVEIPFTAQRNSMAFDLTDFSVRFQVRETYNSSNTIINGTLQNGKIVWVNQAQGQFKFVIQPTDTSIIGGSRFNEDTFECVYDIELVSPLGTVYPGAKGPFTIKREVTR